MKKPFIHFRSLLTTAFRGIFLVLFCCIHTDHMMAQTIVVSSPEAAEMRTRQLLDNSDSAISFTVNPVSRTAKVNWKKPKITVLPLSFIQQYNTHHPYGWNDGAMISANGYQAMLRAGISASYGIFEMQLMPEMVYSANSRYESNAAYGSYTGKSYQKTFPGQSSVRMNIGAVSAGLSSQNLWWGPGIHSSLLMSNNAPGFVHGFISTRRPVKTPIGHLEWQIIGGKLDADRNQGYENNNLKIGSPEINKDWRYLNAFVVSYQPKWVPGLFLGMTRSLQRYKQDIKLSGISFLNQYIPIFTKAISKSDAQADDTMRTDQLASFFLRWMLPKANAEFYVEWGYNDYSQNMRDYLMAPTHSAAHIIGFKKVVHLTAGKYLDFGFEMTRMSQSPDYLVREAGSWYIHGKINQGYTQENQILGAGAGLGCNVQTMTATLGKNSEKLGLILERVERDPQYHVNKWTDYSIGFMPQWKYKGVLFSGVLQFIYSRNYAWDTDVNRFNLHSKISMQYAF